MHSLSAAFSFGRYTCPALSLLLVVGGLASSPLAAQQETGSDDFRISFMGGTGNTTYRSAHAAVAYNATDDEYLVVWTGDTDDFGLLDNQYQVLAQRLDAATGTAIGGLLQVSASTFTLAFLPDYRPAVAWDSTNDQYLVVWSGITGECCEVDYEILARRLSATGAPLAAAAQISHMVGPPANPNEAHYDAYDADVAFNPSAGEFLVVWSGDDGRNGRINDEFEIHGQRILAATGAAVGADDFRISDAGGTGNLFSTVQSPAVVYNAIDDQYLVVWSGDDADAGTADNEFEIYGQRLAGATAAEVGANDFRLSDVGPPGDTNWGALTPDLAHDSVDDQYLVAFAAPETVSGSNINGFEIFAQRLDASGSEIGADDFRLSDAGGTNETAFDADSPVVAYSAASGRYLVGFHADDDQGGQIDGELELFVQAVDGATGAEVGRNDLRVTDVGPNASSLYQTAFPAMAYDSTNDRVLLVWHGDDDSGGLVDNEYEIFGQRLAAGPLFADGFTSGDSSAWSLALP